MIININDSTNSAKLLFYQSLVLLFKPCEKFTLNDTDSSLDVKAYEKDGTYFANVRICADGKTQSCSDSERINSELPTQMKNLIGRTFLKAASSLFGRKPPWGISTGVKPVKLARPIIEKYGENRAFDILTQSYMLDKRKARLCIDAARTENRIMSGLGDKPCSVYISIPFCPSRCDYCSFVSCTTPRLLSLIPDYLVKLKSEIIAISEVIKNCGLNVKSFYVGGGTPAILDEGQIDFLLSEVEKCFDYSSAEFTFEAGRPDCITRKKLEVLKAHNVGRISINTQSTNDEILKGVGRNHTFSDYLCAMDMAGKVGFDCINTDLIAGLPGESVESFKKSIDEVSELNPENITVHAFTLKKSSIFRTNGQTDISEQDKAASEMTDYASDTLTSKGYNPYYIYRQKNTVGNLDNAGFSKNGNESIYNIVMMGEYHTVFAAGAGAVTKLVSHDAKKVERLFSPKYPYEFLDEAKYKGFDAQSVYKFYNENK